MQAALVARLQRWPVRAAEGRGRGWREAHLLVAAPEAVVLRLARLFRQNAVVVARGRVRLVLIRHGHPAGPTVRRMSVLAPFGRAALLRSVGAAGRVKASIGPDAARSQDYLYGEDGLPR